LFASRGDLTASQPPRLRTTPSVVGDPNSVTAPTTAIGAPPLRPYSTTFVPRGTCATTDVVGAGIACAHALAAVTMTAIAANAHAAQRISSAE
jgi:hypothetical protein